MKLADMASSSRKVRSFLYKRYGKPGDGADVEDEEVLGILQLLEDLIEIMNNDAAVRQAERQKKVLAEVRDMDRYE